MGLFDGRFQRPIPDDARRILDQIPSRFIDDGCSNSPDGWFGFDFRWACRIHDWRYCTRCHAPGSMTYEAKLQADAELRRHIRGCLPWRWRWVRYLYHLGVWLGGDFGAWDTCGPEAGEECRHGVEKPWWMEGSRSQATLTERSLGRVVVPPHPLSG